MLGQMRLIMTNSQWELFVNRRLFFKVSSLLTGALLSQKVQAKIQQVFNFKTKTVKSIDPIQEIDFEDHLNSVDFNGDEINKGHEILWNVDGYLARKGGIPQPTQFHSIVIAGGGMSGLLSAYHLLDRNPFIIEQAKSFGGNSKAEKLGLAKYSIGAAYVTLPDENSDIDLFFKKMNLYKNFKVESDNATQTKFNTRLVQDFWKGVTDPVNAEQFIKVELELRRIYNEAYPDIPWTSDSDISFQELCRLDKMTFYDWLKDTFEVLHPHVLEYFQLYCWSSFGGSIQELSAAQVLNFVCAEVDGVMALPGGNAAIAQAVLEYIQTRLSSEQITTSSIVIKVQLQKNGKIWVVYENPDGQLITVECDKVICAFPKFVVEKVVENIPQEKLKALEKITYRGYIVSNVILDRPVVSPGFDIFDLKGETLDMPSAMKPPKKLMTDVCFGSWAQNDRVERSNLTLYRPLPFDGARQFLFNPMSHEKHLKQTQNEVENFLFELGIDTQLVKNYRLTRWGHSLPLAKTSMISDGVVDLIKQPIEDKIYFVNQDNWVNPAFECCFAESLEVAGLV